MSAQHAANDAAVRAVQQQYMAMDNESHRRHKEMLRTIDKEAEKTIQQGASDYEKTVQQDRDLLEEKTKKAVDEINRRMNENRKTFGDDITTLENQEKEHREKSAKQYDAVTTKAVDELEVKGLSVTADMIGIDKDRMKQHIANEKRHVELDKEMFEEVMGKTEENSKNSRELTKKLMEEKEEAMKKQVDAIREVAIAQKKNDATEIEQYGKNQENARVMMNSQFAIAVQKMEKTEATDLRDDVERMNTMMQAVDAEYRKALVYLQMEKSKIEGRYRRNGEKALNDLDSERCQLQKFLILVESKFAKYTRFNHHTADIRAILNECTKFTEILATLIGLFMFPEPDVPKEVVKKLTELMAIVNEKIISFKFVLPQTEMVDKMIMASKGAPQPQLVIKGAEAEIDQKTENGKDDGNEKNED